MTPAEFFTRAAGAFDAAMSSREGFTRDYRIGEWRVRIRFAGLELVQPLTRALDHLRLDEPTAKRGRDSPALADLSVLAWVSTEAGQSPPPADAARWQMGANGFIRSLSDERFAAHWMFAAGGLQMLDRHAGRAIYWVRDANALPAWETGAPMRFLLDAWLAHRGWLLVHAAAVGDARGAILLSGSGGSGKSSTALACLDPGIDPGLDYLGDDYVALNPADGAVYSVYNTGKVDASSLARLPFLAPHVVNPQHLSKEKGLVFVHEAFPHKVRAGPLTVRAIVRPRVGGTGQTGQQPAGQRIAQHDAHSERVSGCRPASAAEILRDFAASTMLQSARPSADVLKGLAQLVRDRPAFELILQAGSPPDLSELAALLPDQRAPAERAISVIVPCYNPGPHLHDALSSICAQGAARRPGAVEIIVVDDGSDEDVRPVLERFTSRLEIRYQRQSRQGPSAARNRGLAMAEGEFIAFLDADDVWPAGSLDLRAAVLASRTDTDIVHGRLRNLVRDDGRRETCFGPPRRSFNVGSMLFRRRVFDRTGPLDERLRFSEDVDLLVRIVETGVPRLPVDDVCLYYRRHGGGLTGPMIAGERSRAHLASWAHILKRSLDRRRA